MLLLILTCIVVSQVFGFVIFLTILTAGLISATCILFFYVSIFVMIYFISLKPFPVTRDVLLILVWFVLSAFGDRVVKPW